MIVSTILTGVVMTILIIIGYLFCGMKQPYSTDQACNVIAAISVTSVLMVYLYNVPQVMDFLGRHNIFVNFALFLVICLPLTLLNYYGEFYLIKWVLNVSDDKSVCGVTFHQQLFFLLNMIVGTIFDGKLLADRPYLYQITLLYFSSWVAWLFFCGITVSQNSSFIDPENDGNYLVASGFLGALVFVGLTRTSIFKHVNFDKLFKNKEEQYMEVSMYVLGMSIIQYAILFLLIRFIFFNGQNYQDIRGQMGSTQLSINSMTWVSQQIVGRHICPLFSHKFNQNSKFQLIIYGFISFILSYIILVPCWTIYNQVVYEFVMIRWMGFPDSPIYNRQDFVYGFGVGNMYLCYYGLLPKSKPLQWWNNLNYWNCKQQQFQEENEYSECSKVGEHLLEVE